jgi:hypothetical protein
MQSMTKKKNAEGKAAKGEQTDSTGKLSNNQEKIIELLLELVKWVKVTSHPQVGKILNEQVQSQAQKLVFQNSDGKRTTKELSALSGMDPADISRDWKQWTKAGLAEQVPAQGGSRGRSLFSLEDFGIDVPKKVEKVMKEKPKQEVKEG